jgi:diacylglycerol kinase family enzyme
VTTLTQLPDNAREVLISLNPHAGARNRQQLVEELCRQLVEHDLQPAVVPDIDALAERAAKSLELGRLRTVIAAGGDGTVRLVAERTPVGTPLAILPLGTENLLSRYLELAANPWQLARLVAGGWIGRFDAGQAGGRLFTLMAGCGFDADVVRRLHGARRGHIHHLSYAKPILESIRKYEYPELRVYCETAASAGIPAAEAIAARWVFVVNLPRYAGGLSIAPGASGTDGLLDVCTFKAGSLWNGLVYLGGVMLGQHEAMQDFARVQTTSLRIECTGGVPYQLDGDPGGELPVEIRVLPGRLTLLVDRAWAVRRGMTPAGEEVAP